MREIVDGKRGVSADTALRLERYFGSDAQGWLALQAAYDLRITEKQNAKVIARQIPPLDRGTCLSRWSLTLPASGLRVWLISETACSAGIAPDIRK
ncbi:HigA family addiction module antitoxin [Orrella daihaiensis]|uniref:HigA family addiction module antitoxin n=1 Tax=Orrella daihaiensis TaxID=2782176 RepID=UPI00351056EF